MLLRGVVALILLTFSAVVFADTIDVNLRDSSAQAEYRSPLGRDPLGKTEFHAGVLYADKNNMVGDIGLRVKDELGDNAPGFSAGVGIKALIARVTRNSPTVNYTSAMALGGMIRYSPPATRRLGFVGEVYLSPNIVTFGDANRYVETVARVEYEVIPQAVGYIGYRRIGVGIKNGPYAILDEGVHIGVRISF